MAYIWSNSTNPLLLLLLVSTWSVGNSSATTLLYYWLLHVGPPRAEKLVFLSDKTCIGMFGWLCTQTYITDPLHWLMLVHVCLCFHWSHSFSKAVQLPGCPRCPLSRYLGVLGVLGVLGLHSVCHYHQPPHHHHHHQDIIWAKTCSFWAKVPLIWMADSISILIKSDSANGCINSSFLFPHQMRNWVKPIIKTITVSECDK